MRLKAPEGDTDVPANEWTELCDEHASAIRDALLGFDPDTMPPGPERDFLVRAKQIVDDYLDAGRPVKSTP